MVGVIGNDLAVKTPLHVRDVRCTQLEPLWLMAQSVPSTSLVPCLNLLPVGWSLGTVAVNDGRSVIELDHDRAGSTAVVLRLTTTCDPGDAIQVRSQVSGVERYERPFAAPDGSWPVVRPVPRRVCDLRAGSATDPDGLFAADTTLMFGFTTRAALGQALEVRSAGRLHLDPTRA